MSDGSVIIEVELTKEQLKKGLKELKSDFGELKRNSGIDTLISGFDRLGEVATIAGKKMSVGVTAPLAVLTKKIVSSGNDFEAQMSRVQAIAGATKEELVQLTQQAMDLGAKTCYSASEVATAMENLASAGFGTNEIMEAMPGLLDLAASSGADLATSAEIASSAVRAFGLEAKDTAHVADVLAEASARTNAQTEDMGYALKYVAPVAHSASMSLEEISAAIGIMSDAGIKGEQAGTTLRGALVRLIRPTKPVATVMEQLGLEFYDSAGKMKSLAEITKMLEEKTKDLTQEEKNNAYATLFGTESLSGMLALTDAGSEKLINLTKAFQSCDGSADEMAKTMLDNTKGAIEEMNGAIETMFIELQRLLAPAVKKFAKYIGDLANKFSKLSTEQKKNIVKTAAIVAAIGPALLIVGKLSKGIANLIKVGKGVTQIISLVKNGTTAIKALSTVLGTANISMIGIVGTVGAVASVLAIAKGHMDSFKTSTTHTNDRLKESIKSYTQEREAILKAQQDTINAEVSQMDNAQRLTNELRTITDENGKVKEGYKQRAEFIVNELNKALGTEMSLNGDVVQGYKEIQGEIDNLILKKKAQIILSSQEEAYTNAIKNQKQALMDLNEAQNNVENARRDMATAKSVRAKTQAEMDLQTAIKNLGEQKKVVQQYYDDITLYETNAMRITSGKQEELKKIVDSVGKTFVDNGKLVESSFKETIDAQRIAVEQAKENYNKQIKNADETQKQILENQLSTSREQLQNTINTLIGMTSTVENDESVINAWKYIAETSYWEFNNAIKDLPEPVKKAIQEMTSDIEKNKTIPNSIETLGKNSKEAANNATTATVSAADLTLENLGKSGWLQNSATELGEEAANNLGQPQVAIQAMNSTLNAANNTIKNSEAIPEAKKHVIKSATEIAQEFDKSQESYNSGDNTVWGAQRGIKNSSAWSSIKVTLTKGGKSIIGWFNKALGEHSPSKFTEQSGIYLGEGFINGIDKIQAKLNQSAKGMGNELIDKINSTVSLETGRISTNLSTTALNNTSFTANINITGNTYMDSEKVGRMTAPAVAKTFRGGGAYAN